MTCSKSGSDRAQNERCSRQGGESRSSTGPIGTIKTLLPGLFTSLGGNLVGIDGKANPQAGGPGQLEAFVSSTDELEMPLMNLELIYED